MIYAFGQNSNVEGQVKHAPASSLESGSGLNTHFYKPKALLFHGGGVGRSTSPLSHENRGGWSDLSMFPDEPAAASRCLASTSDDYECMLEVGEGYRLHWTADTEAKTVKIGAEAQAQGWVAVAFHEDSANGGNMINAHVSMLCCAVLCCVTLRHVTLRYVTLRCVTLRYVRYVMFCSVLFLFCSVLFCSVLFWLQWMRAR